MNFDTTIDHLRELVLPNMDSYIRKTFGKKGPLLEILSDYPTRPSKGLRPALCLGSCGLVGGDIKSALNTACAIEFLHNAFLVKDDLVDGSNLRRFDDTLNKKYGFELA